MPVIVAPLTPITPSPAIVIRISGVGCFNIISKMVDIKGTIEPRKVLRGFYHSISNANIQDDVLVTHFKAPHSYTGEDVVELSFHGNPIIANSAMDDFMSLGARLAEKGEFTRRAYLNQKISLLQAEAVDTLIRAHTDKGVKASINNVLGGLDDRFGDVRDRLLGALARMEASIDFAADTADDIDMELMNDINKCMSDLKRLIDGYESNQIAINGVQVAIIGEPNSGKSTLFNRLLDTDRAIVSEEAGTTRDTLSELIRSDGVNIVLTDTAGVRQSSSVAEKAGIERTLRYVDSADLLILVLDLTKPISAEITSLMERLGSKRRIIVGNKSDIATSSLGIKPDLLISAKENENIAELRTLLSHEVKELLPDLVDDFTIIAERQYIECKRAVAELLMVDADIAVDMQAYHLRKAIESLDSARGKLVAEDMLDSLFSKFCIGK